MEYYCLINYFLDVIFYFILDVDYRLYITWIIYQQLLVGGGTKLKRNYIWGTRTKTVWIALN
jgi:hypothetical protein